MEIEAIKKRAWENFAKISNRGTKWKNRNIPVYIRRHLMIPFYLSEVEKERKIAIITPPNEHNQKVHFQEFTY